MKVSLLIPTYNASATIRNTLNSVLSQTVPPDEILILDDGSSDETVSLLKAYKPRVSIFQQKNGGVAKARNQLCALATGDLVFFLDHDDIWHPQYVEVQCQRFSAYPKAVGFFTGHIDFYGYENYEWNGDDVDRHAPVQIFEPSSMLKALTAISGTFVSPSFFCIPRQVLAKIGKEPFCEAVPGVDDFYLYTLLTLFGSIVYSSIPLGGYRNSPSSQSRNILRGCKHHVGGLEALENRFREMAPPELFREFRRGFASARRQYARRLLGAQMDQEARRQLWLSMATSGQPQSLLKSLVLLGFSCGPKFLQPSWPKSYREVNGTEKA